MDNQSTKYLGLASLASLASLQQHLPDNAWGNDEMKQ